MSSSGDLPAPPHKKTFAFFGATTGCGLAALTAALAEGHTCVALCRNPAKLTDHPELFSSDTSAPSLPPNLRIVQGDAHDAAAVRKCLIATPTEAEDQTTRKLTLVDAVLTSIGSRPSPDCYYLALEDPRVCETGAEVLVGVLQELASAAEGDALAAPLVVAVSSAGASRFGRDFPLLAAPVYRVLLKGPHADKRAMERVIATAATTAVRGLEYVLVRPSLLVDGEGEGREVRVGVEDWEEGVRRREIGWTISRGAVGRWVWEKVLRRVGGEDGEGERFEGKVVSLTW
ncbi:hypothetical protein F4810DRAFT_525078 [Camillea tinctor]|nr:hypothetical protein F4810DRAFT_525078 [Camillea tinctor]